MFEFIYGRDSVSCDMVKPVYRVVVPVTFWFLSIEYWPKLTEWLKNIGQGEYAKGRKDMFQVLWPFMDYAIANAERLDKLNEGKPPASAAPGTKVHELIKHLRPYLNVE